MDDRPIEIRIPRRWLRRAVILGAVALAIAPVTALATHSFSDVPDSNTFHNDIAWLKDADVTRGCNPPTNNLYCPDDNVTRGQMAAFMKRLAENQVVDAATVGGRDATGLVSPLVVSSPPAGWVAQHGIGTVEHHVDRTEVIGGPAHLALPTPQSIGGHGYGLQSLEICYRATTGGIGRVSIHRSVASGPAAEVFVDLTSRTSSTFTCFAVNPRLLAGKGLSVTVLGSASLGGVTATWTSDTNGFG